MKIGIFSDIHSNLEGLQAVLEDMVAQDVTHTICLGDIVGYNADPLECLRVVQTLNCPVIKGNHDEMAATASQLEHFNANAREAIAHTVSCLSKKDLEYLDFLPRTITKWGFSAAHDTLDSPGSWNYVVGVGEASVSFNYQRTRVCFIGHTHVPKVFEKNNYVMDHPTLKYPIQLQRNHKYLINVGSAGQPRDKDWRVSWCLFDTHHSQFGTITIRRIEYDIQKAQKKIRKCGLPEFLAERLAIGT